jgi:hypothetical protein
VNKKIVFFPDRSCFFSATVHVQRIIFTRASNIVRIANTI